MTHPMTIRGEATAYRLWCAARDLDWDCTIAEAARAAGIDCRTAWSAVNRKGWRGRFSSEEASRAKSRNMRRVNAMKYHDETSAAVDVCDMMQWGEI